jgi:phosphoserine aminotransferase
MSSTILSRTINVLNFGVIFAGAQKNIGPAGVTIVIIRRDLIPENPDKNPLIPPLMLDYKTFSDSKSLYNTPPTFPIYVSGLVFKWILESGGLERMSEMNTFKASRLYQTIKNSNGFYNCPVKEEYQSRMNIPFRILTNGQVNQNLEEKFLKNCKESNLVGLSGHRSVGGIRASIYNAMSVDGVDALIKLLNEFRENEQKKS